MESHSTGARKHALTDTDRLEAFSDSVMAVIITIMAFSLKQPAGSDIHSLVVRVPALLVYLLSFAFIGIYWNNHHHLLRAADRMDSRVMWANLLLLFWLSLIPLVTGWIASFPERSLPASVYGVLCLLAAVSYWLLTHAIIRANGSSSRIAQALGSDVKGMISIGLYVLAVVLSFLSPFFAYALFATVTCIWVIPDRRISDRN